MTERIAALKTKRSLLVQHATELADERASCSYAACVQYDVEARKRLSEINAALAVFDSELRNIDAAISEASKRTEAA
jgi:hypothetical protein